MIGKVQTFLEQRNILTFFYWVDHSLVACDLIILVKSQVTNAWSRPLEANQIDYQILLFKVSFNLSYHFGLDMFKHNCVMLAMITDKMLLLFDINCLQDIAGG